jgi:hypothetical protein
MVASYLVAVIAMIFNDACKICEDYSHLKENNNGEIAIFAFSPLVS